MLRTLALGIAVIAFGGCTLRTAHQDDYGGPTGPRGPAPYRTGPAMGNTAPLPMTEPAPTPATPPVAAPLPPPPEPLPAPPEPLVVKYKIRSGDILGRISQKFYGTSKKWRMIAKHNNLNPKKLKVGQVIEIPEPTQGYDD